MLFNVESQELPWGEQYNLINQQIDSVKLAIIDNFRDNRKFNKPENQNKKTIFGTLLSPWA